MARITVEDCLKKVPNRFQLVHMAAKRVRQIREGSEYLVNAPKNEDIVIALREIAAQRVRLKTAAASHSALKSETEAEMTSLPEAEEGALPEAEEGAPPETEAESAPAVEAEAEADVDTELESESEAGAETEAAAAAEDEEPPPAE